MLRNPVITAPVVGTTKPHHLDDALAAPDVDLTDDGVTQFDELSQPPRLGLRALTPLLVILSWVFA